eukprot:TRINITY_DN3305_c0_g2_i4.p1 TRINITY_DN3305_c0_g2~~TRINITY_DN3305_c0_g2_i4.p1  ORF type:complete len:132 (-),score=24.94 TRINITY_DN3305_c0_g2_i4:76-471(-)
MCASLTLIPPCGLEEKPRTFAFLEFELPEDAFAAVDNMHQSELCGKLISCSIAQAQNPVPKSKPVWSDETYMRNATQPASDAADTDGAAPKPSPSPSTQRVQSTTLTQNAPKRAKTAEQTKSAVPEGLSRW